MSDIMLVWKKCRAHLCLEEIMFKIQTEAAAGESSRRVCVSVCEGGRDLGASHCGRGGQSRGGFKLDLDSPGDTPHRISPLSQTQTCPRLLTVACSKGQKKKFWWSNSQMKVGIGCSSLPPSPANSPPSNPIHAHTTTTTIPCQFNPAD